MRKGFEQFLIKMGYSKTTPSTVYDYQKRIDRVCEYEGYTWEQLAINILNIVKQYDRGGIKEEIGNKSHRAVINALKQFNDFVKTR